MIKTSRQVLTSEVERILDGVAGPSLVNAVMVAVDAWVREEDEQAMQDEQSGEDAVPLLGSAPPQPSVGGSFVSTNLSTDGDAARLRRRQRIDETARMLFAVKDVDAATAYRCARELEEQREHLIKVGSL